MIAIQVYLFCFSLVISMRAGTYITALEDRTRRSNITCANMLNILKSIYRAKQLRSAQFKKRKSLRYVNVRRKGKTFFLRRRKDCYELNKQIDYNLAEHKGALALTVFQTKNTPNTVILAYTNCFIIELIKRISIDILLNIFIQSLKETSVKYWTIKRF